MRFEDEVKEFEAKAARFADAAFPLTLKLQHQTRPFITSKTTVRGLSKREYFAGMALQGLMSNLHNLKNGSTEYAALTAVAAADDLIRALAKV